MKNLKITPVTGSTRQLTLTAAPTMVCATSALPLAAPLAAEGIAVRTTANAFAAFDADVVATQPAKRDRATTGMGRRGIAAAYVPGPHAWSPPT